jgi:hypothetical protein
MTQARPITLCQLSSGCIWGKGLAWQLIQQFMLSQDPEHLVQM